MISNKNIPTAERLIFALDVDNQQKAKELVNQLDDTVNFYKLGLEFFMSGSYYPMLEWLLAKDKKIFVDLKFFDVPQTVASAVRQLRNKGATFATVHGNDSILQAAVAEKGETLKILAVTVLTSLDRGDLDDLGFQCDVKQLVLSRAQRAFQLGCDGVISSGLEAKDLRGNLAENFLIVTPGIRPVDNKVTDDQKRTVDVEEAFTNGADYIVIGRPIREAADPYLAAKNIQERMGKVFD
ncbi:orotidine-5'-phosphate decarboxylase [Xenococcus sp. PCC 7305]|uniref:orotidine-5'-phosphate decarboxylase n=1 Tax=Xenococcus sp. PCC 7305 TaxID=102125 RepID=UPI0002ACD246|nr:orotidine-5'-phosphate decarboxylase [Xenococcus sp. PCC 7305]ELS01996.1 orotidine-5'-phosphate decarboxylase [Xenococcus sp. PCC 7305]